MCSIACKIAGIFITGKSLFGEILFLVIPGFHVIDLSDFGLCKIVPWRAAGEIPEKNGENEKPAAGHQDCR